MSWLSLVTAGPAGCRGFFIDGHTSTVLSSSSISAAYEASITWTAKVYNSDVLATSATGTVAFYVDSTELGTASLSSGQATYSTTSLTIGTHSVYAVYEGDSTYNASTSNDLTLIISETLAATTTTLSASATTLTSGSALTMTATVDISAASGTVTFYDDTTGTPVVLGTATIKDGVASLSVTSLSVGSHSLYATYIGDSTYAMSTSSSITVTVT